MNRRFLVLCGFVLALGLGVLGFTMRWRLNSVREFQQQVELARAEGERARAEAEKVRENTVVPTENRVPSARNFAAALQKLGLTSTEASGASQAAEQAFNLRQLRAGNSVIVNRSLAGELREIDYRIDPDRMLRIVPAQPEGFSAEVKAIPSQTEIVNVTGQLNDSLFNAVEDAGESAELAMRLAQIFAYDLDFYTDTRKGDQFRVVLEKKKYSDGKTAGYGKILAAEYDNGGKKYRALLFHDELGHPAYYSADGKSLQKSFLRSPLKFGAPITSHFSNARFHPILKITRPHLGTDYGAPIGTPVQTIGSGRVVFAGRKGGDGNMVHIAHNNGYETMYLHLSKIFVRSGQHVEIGKTIGLVGMTGLATGPHLDFRISQKGQFKNFERLGLPPSDPVSKRNLPEFAALREKWLPALEHPELLQTESVTSAANASVR